MIRREVEGAAHAKNEPSRLRLALLCIRKSLVENAIQPTSWWPSERVWIAKR